MSDEEVYKKIEEVYNDEKGKGFITHLIRSFLPINRSTFMLFKDEKKKMRCALTNTPLICKEELAQFQIENSEQILKNMTDRLLGRTTENIVYEKFKGKVLAVECEKSDKLLCLPVVQQLLNFASTEMLKGNRHIEHILKDERIKEGKLIDTSSRKPNSHHQKQEERKRVVIQATTSLGDFEALKNLKSKLDNGSK